MPLLKNIIITLPGSVDISLAVKFATSLATVIILTDPNYAIGATDGLRCTPVRVTFFYQRNDIKNRSECSSPASAKLIYCRPFNHSLESLKRDWVRDSAGKYTNTFKIEGQEYNYKIDSVTGEFVHDIEESDHPSDFGGPRYVNVYGLCKRQYIAPKF